MDTFDYIISPFVWLIEYFFLISYKLTNNYGTAIVLLSFLISAVILPVFILIEKAKKKDNAIKLRMKPVADEIKRCYKGQERHYYLRTLNRQFGYKPFHALIPILSLLLQIPFFIAAYQYLENFEPLSGVSFLFIEDLSKPDALFGPVNFLPIAMTVVNLLTAWFYTRNGNVSERRQMVIVAGIFLVLLFRLPSGLVLYWTMNNVFSFFRLFITNREVFRRHHQTKSKHSLTEGIKKLLIENDGKRLIRISTVIAVLLVLIQFNWALQNSFSDFALRSMICLPLALFLGFVVIKISTLYSRYEAIVLSIRIPRTYLFTGVYFAMYFWLASVFYFKDHNVILIVIAACLSIALELVALLYLIKAYKEDAKLRISYFLIFIVVLLQLSNIIVAIGGNALEIDVLNTQLSIKSGSWQSVFYSSFIVFVFSFKNYLGREVNNDDRQNSYIFWPFLLLVLFISAYVFYWNPLQIYASYPENFNFSGISFFSGNFTPFILAVICPIFLYLLFPNRIRIWLFQFVTGLAIIVFVYGVMLSIDVGTLQVSFFSNEENMAKPVYYYVAESVFLFGIIVLTRFIFKRIDLKKLGYGVLVIHLLVSAQSLNVSLRTESFFHKTKEVIGNEHEIPFSKTKENIVIYVADGAQGWYMMDMATEDSTLRNAFSGFTYYPNTLSMANYTYASVPSMMSGYDYSIEAMNAMKDKTIIEKVTEATEVFYSNIKENDYFFTTTMLKYSNIDHSKFDNYLPKWNDAWSGKIGLDETYEMWYTRLWENALFNSLPLFIKPRIYNDRNWIVKEKKFVNSSEYQKYNFDRVLPYISNAESKNKNFIYIHSMYTHTPWDIVTDENKVINDVTPYENQKAFTYTFVRWLEWMKENDVYDNTKIVLVADHGPSWWHFKGETNPGTAPIVNRKDELISLEHLLHLTPLLMVKEFDSEFPMRDDWRLMSNADVHSIVFDEVNPANTLISNRSIPTFYTRWHTDLYTRVEYENKASFVVVDSVYNLKNWTRVE